MAITDHLLGWLTCHRLGLLKKDLGGRSVPFFTEADLNQITGVINGPVGVAPPPKTEQQEHLGHISVVQSVKKIHRVDTHTSNEAVRCSSRLF